MPDSNATVLEWVSTKMKSGGVAATGKQAAHNGLERLGMSVGVSGSAIANVMMMGAIGAVSAVSNQLEYYDSRAHLANFYREELAAKEHKANNQVGDADLSNAEKNNATINEAVGRERSFRNLGIAASFIASVAVFGLVSIAFPHGLGAAAVMSNATLAAVVDFGAKAALGGLAYMATKAPLMQIGMSLFGLNKETTHDLIVNLTKDRERGKAITREQVVEVFVSGNKEISGYVESSFGKAYDELTLADKVNAAAELANVIPIDKIVQNINRGTANVSELAFTVVGEFSGALPKVPEREKKPETMLGMLVNKCKQLFHSVTGMFGAEKAQNMEQVNKLDKTAALKQIAARCEESPIVEFNNTPGFAERLGRAPVDQRKGYVQQLAERSQQVSIPGSNTLQ